MTKGLGLFYVILKYKYEIKGQIDTEASLALPGEDLFIN